MITHPAHPAHPKCCSRMGVITLIIAVAALALGGFATYKANKCDLGEKEFSGKVEKGINDFIAKKQAEQNGAPAAPTEPIKVSLANAAIKGDKNAPVTMLEFSDFECPFCSRFALNTLPQIVSDYIDKGKVKLAFRNFPLGFHQYAKTAAIAAECAREQGGDEMFFKLHDKVYADQQSLSVESLKKWAGELGIKMDQFNTCLDTKKYEKQVDADMKDGQSYGVNGTPAFFINGRMISGAQPFDNFKKIIDEELQKAGK
jgi:protein-disulfide isomerase